MSWKRQSLKGLILLACVLNAATTSTSGRPSPLLANERYLVEDFLKVLNGELLILDPNLIFTTYNNLWSNVVLDVNLLFEEILQELIEDDKEFDTVAANAVGLIHDNLKIKSIVGMLNISKDPTLFRSSRLQWINKTLSPLPKCVDFSENILADYSSDQWKAFSQNYSDPDRKGLVKLLKMIVTQYPYFGGSLDYMFGEIESLEFWAYHLSTLTRDPDRTINASKLPKPYMDYRTYSMGKLPLDNQRNLGTGITEVNFTELPFKLQTEIIQILTDQHQNSQVDLYYLRRDTAYISILRPWRNLTKPDTNDVALLWDDMDEDGKKQIFGDVLKLPWSNAHLVSGSGKGDYNVVGVRGNILELPAVAASRYQTELDNAFDGTEVPGSTFILNDRVVKNATAKTDLIAEFIQTHGSWYNLTYSLCRPIIGGISGHTLGYLNLYIAAINSSQLNSTNLAVSMELVRAIMLGALIGLKRHHSYDEVMTASVGFPDGVGGFLKYNPEGFYSDVILSKESLIQRAAATALSKLMDNLKNPPENSTLHYVKLYWPYSSVLPVLQDYVKGINNVSRTIELLSAIPKGESVAPSAPMAYPSILMLLVVAFILG